MQQHLAAIALLIPEYDEAIAYYRDTLVFEPVEDTPLGGGKRWVRVQPAGAQTSILLARAKPGVETARIGDLGGGRVMLFLHTDDFARDHAVYAERGVCFTEAPRHEPYGTVAVFADRYGNLWDLIQPDAPFSLPAPPGQSA